MEEHTLPKFDYYIDESDPDTVILRRQGGTFVAAFSARGATKEGLLEAAKEDYWRLIEANADLFEPSIRRRPKEERLSLGRPYSRTSWKENPAKLNF
jgi:hypothetical protein